MDTGKYSIAFWKFKDAVSLNNLETYNSLSKGIYLEGVEELPIDKIKQEIAKVFNDWTYYDNIWHKNDDEEFKIYLNSQFLRIDCIKMLSGKDMNKFTDIMVDFCCHLYDAQIDRRFDEYPLMKGENYYI